MALEISEILSNYDLDVRNCVRIRGGFLLDTEKGYKLLREFGRSKELLTGLNEFRKCLIEAGYSSIDTFFESKEDSLYTEYDDKTYVVMNYFNARECDIGNEKEVLAGVRELAMLHKAFDNMKTPIELPYEADCRTVFEKRTRELKRARTFIHSKKMKNEFEIDINYDGRGNEEQRGLQKYTLSG